MDEQARGFHEELAAVDIAKVQSGDSGELDRLSKLMTRIVQAQTGASLPPTPIVVLNADDLPKALADDLTHRGFPVSAEEMGALSSHLIAVFLESSGVVAVAEDALTVHPRDEVLSSVGHEFAHRAQQTVGVFDALDQAIVSGGGMSTALQNPTVAALKRLTEGHAMLLAHDRRLYPALEERPLVYTTNQATVEDVAVCQVLPLWEELAARDPAQAEQLQDLATQSSFYVDGYRGVSRLTKTHPAWVARALREPWVACLLFQKGGQVRVPIPSDATAHEMAELRADVAKMSSLNLWRFDPAVSPIEVVWMKPEQPQ